eukprot:200791_1
MRRNTALREEREMKEKLRKEKHENERVLRLEMEYRERMRKQTVLREYREQVRKEREQKEKEKEKTYTIVCPAGATVTAEKDIRSRVLGVLHVHRIVIVEEMDGRRCRISDPSNEVCLGWVSLRTVAGTEILKKGV